MSQKTNQTSAQPAPTQAIKSPVPSSHLDTKSLHDGPGLTDDTKRLAAFTPPLIQPKLKIGAPNDKYEQEAERVAEQVMRMPVLNTVQTQTSPPRIQRFCPECEQEIHRQPEEEEEEELIQTKAESGRTPQLNPGIASQIQGLKGGGQALDSATRAFMEPRFGQDFGQVRIHADNRAAGLAQSVNARAFTLGRDVVFGAGQYQSQSTEGQRLMAHELAHVVQQAGRVNTIMREAAHPERRTPEEMVEDYYTNIGLVNVLDVNRLGQDLYLLVWRSEAHIEYVMRVIDAVPWLQRDNVAYAFVHPLTDEMIRSLAATDRGRILLLKIRDELASGTPWGSEQTEIDRINRIGRGIINMMPPGRESELIRKRIVLRFVKYDEAELDPDTLGRRAAEILDQCGIDVSWHTITPPPTREQTLDDLDGDTRIDLGVFSAGGEGENVRRRSGASANHEVAVALVKEIRAGVLEGLDGFTPEDNVLVAVANGAPTETVAHEVGHYFGQEHLVSRMRLMHEESGTRRGVMVIPWECSDIRRRI